MSPVMIMFGRPALAVILGAAGTASAFAPSAVGSLRATNYNPRPPPFSEVRRIPMLPEEHVRAAEEHPLTVGMQAMHATAALSLLAAPMGDGVMDDALASLWSFSESQAWLTHTPLFEAHVAVFAFVAWIFFYETVHLWLPDAHKWRLDGKNPINTLACFDPRRDVHKSLVPAITYLGSIWLGQQVGLFTFLYGAKPDFVEAPSFLRFITEVSLGVVMYDLLFYPFHRAFHTGHIFGVPLGAKWRDLHMRHHRFGGDEVHAHNACETVQNSYVDAGLQVFINIFVQQLSPWGFAHKHPLSRVFHNLMVTYLLTEAHSGYDLPFQSHRLFPSVFGGTVRHEEHHQGGATCYHQFFKYLDDWTNRGPRAVHARPLGRDAMREEEEGEAEEEPPPLRWLASEAEAAERVGRGEGVGAQQQGRARRGRTLEEIICVRRTWKAARSRRQLVS